MKTFTQTIDDDYNKYLATLMHTKWNGAYYVATWEDTRDFFIKYFSEMGMDFDKAVDEKVQDILDKVFKKISTQEVVQEVMKQYKEKEVVKDCHGLEYVKERYQDMEKQKETVLVEKEIWEQALNYIQCWPPQPPVPYTTTVSGTCPHPFRRREWYTTSCYKCYECGKIIT